MRPEDLIKEERPILWIPVGVVGAGKTTFALRLWKLAPHSFLRVSLDDIIQMMSFYGYQKHLSFLYGSLEETSILKGITRGYQVYVDRTNLTRDIRERFINIVKKIESLAGETLKIWESASEAGIDPREEVALYLSQSTEEPEFGFESELKGCLKEILVGPSYPTLLPEPTSREDPREHLLNLTRVEKVVIYFEIDPDLALKRRLKDPYAPLREVTGRKIDWEEVLQKMLSYLTIPRKDEGFTHGFKITPDGTTENMW